MLSIDQYEVLPPVGSPQQYDNPPLGADFSGSFEEYNDLDTSSDQIGSGAELGGVSSPVGTPFGSRLTEADTVNLTGMSESPMLFGVMDGPNVNGSGSAARQLPSRSLNYSATQVSQALQSEANWRGISLATLSSAPRRARGPMVLQQSRQSGMSLSGNMALFFFIGALFAVVVWG
jgi:hypothetical protein